MDRLSIDLQQSGMQVTSAAQDVTGRDDNMSREEARGHELTQDSESEFREDITSSLLATNMKVLEESVALSFNISQLSLERSLHYAISTHYHTLYTSSAHILAM